MSHRPPRPGPATLPNRHPNSVAELLPGIWLDARRAVWFEQARTLAVADLHLGYVWAHRHAGQMMPLSATERTVERLLELVEDYQPTEVAILGDIVHRAVPVAALEDELRRLCSELGARTTLRLLSGNHDRNLAKLLGRCGITLELQTELALGPHLLLHGDEKNEAVAAETLKQVRARSGVIFMGHEHPAVHVGDGVTSMKCPCFLAGPELVVLPAFSQWAAGSNVARGQFLSAIAARGKFQRAVAILAGKLLPLRV